MENLVVQKSSKYPAAIYLFRVTVGVMILSLLLVGGDSSNARHVNPTLAVLKSRERHAIVISVDGLSAEFLAKELREGRLPNIARLKAEGSYAEGVTGTFPSLTAPAHAALVTGRLPAESGICTYARFSQRDLKHQAWTSKDIRVPALWDIVRQAHLTSAAISWPLANGATITWNLTGVLNTRSGYVAVLKRLAKWASPEMVVQALEGLGTVTFGNGKDALRARAAVALIKEYKPNLLLHFANLHYVQSVHGAGSPQAAAALKRVDTYIGELLAAVKSSGLDDSTNIFVVSGHGFESCHVEIEPNVFLAKAGLLTVNKDGKVTGGKVRTVENDGSFFLYWPESEDLKARVEVALRPLQERGLVQSVLDRDDLARLGADPRIRLALEAPRGAFFGEKATGAPVHRLKRARGADGYLPSLRAMQAVFIAAGPGIKPGVNLHEIQITTIASTILEASGIDAPQFGVHLAIFVPGCCSDNATVWSAMETGGTYLRGVPARNRP